MTNPELLIWVGGAVVILNAGTQIAVNIISETILHAKKNGKNGFCGEHHLFKETLDSIKESHKEEKQEEMMERVLTKALKKNGKW